MVESSGCSMHLERACVYPKLGLVLVDRAVRNCGVLEFPASTRARKAAQTCAKIALASRSPVRFGSGWIGVDAASCSVVVRDANGQLWAIQHSYDVSVELGEKLFVGRCSGVTFPAADATSWENFDVTGCTFDQAGYDRVAASLGWAH